MAHKESSAPNNEPIHELRVGNIVLAVWENEGENGTFLRGSISRIYRDGEGQWQRSENFSATDLAVLACVAQQGALEMHLIHQGELVPNRSENRQQNGASKKQ